MVCIRLCAHAKMNTVHLCMYVLCVCGFFCLLVFFFYIHLLGAQRQSGYFVFCIAKCKKAYCRERDLRLSVGLTLMYAPAPQMSHPITQKNYTSLT